VNLFGIITIADITYSTLFVSRAW